MIWSDALSYNIKRYQITKERNTPPAENYLIYADRSRFTLLTLCTSCLHAAIFTQLHGKLNINPKFPFYLF